MQTLKQKLIEYFGPRLFSDYLSTLKMMKEANERVSDKLKTEKAQFEDMKHNLTVTDLVREKLAGFNPRLVDGVRCAANSETGAIDVLSDIFSDAKLVGVEEKDFLADCKTLSNNRALPIILNYVIRNQIVFSARAVQNFNQVLFGGATINGVELVREEIERMAAIFEERNTAPEKYDKHEAL